MHNTKMKNTCHNEGVRVTAIVDDDDIVRGVKKLPIMHLRSYHPNVDMDQLTVHKPSRKIPMDTWLAALRHLCDTYQPRY